MSNALTNAANLSAPWQSFTPALIGATDNPAATYSTQTGRFKIEKGMVFFEIELVTTTMTKTTTADQLRISLPIAAGGPAGTDYQGAARVENGTAVANGTQCIVTSGDSFAVVRYIPATAASSNMTYAATAPGIGVLTNTITFLLTGSYQI